MEAMLKSMGMASDYYRSKYREPVNDMPSKKNKEFAEALKKNTQSHSPKRVLDWVFST